MVLRRLLFTGIVAIALGLGSFSFALGVPKDGAWLLRALRNLADEGATFNPERVAEMLSLTLAETQHETDFQPEACATNPAGLRSVRVTSYASTPDWLKPSAEGVQEMKIPAFTINPAAVSGALTFQYTQTNVTLCTGDYDLAESHAAELSITLPAFACYRREDLVKALGAKHDIATDGVELVTYRGLTNDRLGTNLQFVFRFGAPCALAAEILQETKRGYRYGRAYQKWKACTKEADRRYCATNGAISWSDGGRIKAMNAAAVQSCGKFSSYYEKEPLTGEAPPALTRQFSRSPCDQ